MTRSPKTTNTNTNPQTSTPFEPSDVADSDSPSEDENTPNAETINAARKLVVFNINQQLMDDAGNSTALLQALAKFRFKFNTPEGVTKTCGEDFLNIDIPRDARVKNAKTKGKVTGKKSNTGHNSAQERDQEILVLETPNEEIEMLGKQAATKEKNPAGPSKIEKEDRDRKEEKGKRKEQAEATKRSDENKTPKRKSSQRYRWINFYHEESSRAFKEAKEFRTSHQLLVHGLPKTLLAPTKAGTQERVLNDLMAGLSQERLGEDGINLVQENIIGAYPIEPTPRDRSPVTRITLDSRETKPSIRKAAGRAGRWGNGTHSVFFRDITFEKRRRKSSNEDTNTPKRGKLEDTPKRGKEQKMTRLAQIGAQIRRESWSEERPREERARTAWQRQKERDDRESHRIQIKIDQQKARMAKLEHQRKEEEDAKEKICDKQKPAPSQPKTSPITPFRAVNEPEPTGTPMPGDPEGTAKSEDYETEESTEVFLKGSSEDDIELPDSESEFESLRSGEEEYDLEPDFDLEHDLQPQEEEPHLSPEREVSFTPL